MRTKKQVMQDANLDELPDDEFMAALEEIESRQAKRLAGSANRKSPPAKSVGDVVISNNEQLMEIFGPVLTVATLGKLLAEARAESGLTLEQVGAGVGSGKSWAHQAERKQNLEVASLVKLAGAMGYKVEIRFEPMVAGRRPLRVELGGKP